MRQPTIYDDCTCHEGTILNTRMQAEAVGTILQAGAIGSILIAAFFALRAVWMGIVSMANFASDLAEATPWYAYFLGVLGAMVSVAFLLWLAKEFLAIASGNADISQTASLVKSMSRAVRRGQMVTYLIRNQNNPNFNLSPEEMIKAHADHHEPGVRFTPDELMDYYQALVSAQREVKGQPIGLSLYKEPGEEARKFAETVLKNLDQSLTSEEKISLN